MLGLSIGLALFIILVIFLVLLFEVWMFVDALKNPRLTDTEKMLWCLGMLFIHPVIAIVYYFIAYSKRTPLQ